MASKIELEREIIFLAEKNRQFIDEIERLEKHNEVEAFHSEEVDALVLAVISLAKLIHLQNTLKKERGGTDVSGNQNICLH